MNEQSNLNFWSIGLAMFAMFFGAGNIAFPILLGQHAGSNNHFAITGMLISAVFIPFLGLASMLTFSGDYNLFFNRLGKKTGFLLIIAIMLLIGPFGASPRCITLSYATASVFMPGISLSSFSLIACFVIFGLTIKKNKVVNIMGLVLTPILLLSLFIIIVRGFQVAPPIENTEQSPSPSFFWYGFKQGYQTMDLFASFFFSIVIIPAFRTVLGSDLSKHPKKVTVLATKCSLVGIFLLGTIYTCMSFLSTHYTSVLSSVPAGQQLAVITKEVLGPSASFVSNLAVSLACLTTAMTLTVVFAEFLRKDIFKNALSYNTCLILTLIVTFGVSCLGFDGLLAILAPVLLTLTPAMIILAVCNLLHQFYGFQMVRIPVFTAFLLTLIFTWLN